MWLRREAVDDDLLGAFLAVRRDFFGWHRMLRRGHFVNRFDQYSAFRFLRRAERGRV